jgi:hypothetical protein
MSFCDRIKTALSETMQQGISCVPAGDDRLLITLPLLFSDGDAVELLVEERDGQVSLSDNGEVHSRLSLAGVDITSDRVADLTMQTIKGYGVGQEDGELFLTGPSQHLGRLLLDMGSAVVAMDALEVLRSEQGPRSFPVELVDFLKGTVPIVQEGPHIVSPTGKTYRLTAGAQHALDAPVTYVQALSAGGRKSAPQSNYALRVFVDLAEVLPPTQRLVVLQGPAESYPVQDLRLLERYAFVGSWSSRLRMARWLNTPPEERAEDERLLMPAGRQSSIESDPRRF